MSAKCKNCGKCLSDRNYSLGNGCRQCMCEEIGKIIDMSPIVSPKKLE